MGLMPSSGPRVVISGIGVVSPFGVGRERFWQHVSGGCSGTRAITHFDVSTYPCQVAAWVPPVSIADACELDGDGHHDGRADPKRYSRAALFGVIAAREAWRDAGLRAGEAGAGVLIGSGGGGIDVGEKQYEDFFTTGGRHVTPYAIAVGICGMVSSEISISLGLRGMSHVLSCGCTSSTDAIGYATSLIRAGEYDVVLSGGTDGCVLPGMIFGFSRMRAVSTRYNDRPAAASRPFDRGRDGFVLGEGAWMLVIEREDRARARGAQIYGAICGYESSSEGGHLHRTDLTGETAVHAIETAIEQACAEPTDIDYVCAHGNAMIDYDVAETTALKRTFGHHAYHVPVSSLKAMCGQAFSASAAIQVVATSLVMRNCTVFPTINLEYPDSACDLDYVPNRARPARVRRALIHSHAMGGSHSALVLHSIT